MSRLRRTHLRQTQNPPLLSKYSVDDNDDFVVDDEVTFGRNIRSREFGKIIHENDILSDYVKFRLWLARQLALGKFEKVWG